MDPTTQPDPSGPTTISSREWLKALLLIGAILVVIVVAGAVLYQTALCGCTTRPA